MAVHVFNLVPKSTILLTLEVESGPDHQVSTAINTVSAYLEDPAWVLSELLSRIHDLWTSTCPDVRFCLRAHKSFHGANSERIALYYREDTKAAYAQYCRFYVTRCSTKEMWLSRTLLRADTLLTRTLNKGVK